MKVSILLLGLAALSLSACIQGRVLQVGEPRLAYEIEYFNDHTVVYNPDDGLWHVFGIISPQSEFIHLVSESLTSGDWTRHDNFNLGDGTEIWAPHIVRDNDGLYHMFYTRIGSPREIGHSVSDDLFHWAHTEEPILALRTPSGADAKNKDPMILRDGDRWIMYYSRVKERVDGEDYWALGTSVSTDLVHWTDHSLAFDEDRPADPGVESPFVVRRGDRYYLFLSARPWPSGGVDVFISEDPLHWEAADEPDHRVFPWHAAEVVRDLDGIWYLTLSGGFYEQNGLGDDFKIAALQWLDGLDGETTSMPVPGAGTAALMPRGEMRRRTESDTPPNIVLIIGDDISAEDLGCYGNPGIQTPNIDRIAANGMRFDRAYLTASSCSPSRASIVTGRWPHANGNPDLATGALLQEGLPWPMFFDGLDYFPQLLQDAGYYTAQSGKWHLGYHWSRASGPAADGFDDTQPSQGPGGEEGWVGVLQDRPKGRPFFLWLASDDAHRGWAADRPKIHQPEDVTVPPYLPDTPAVRADLAAYYDEIARLDHYIGRVVEELDRQNILNNTLIVFVADNGRPFFRSKAHIYDSGVKTPFIVHWPDRVAPGQVCDALISAIDIAPTFVSAAQLEFENSTFQGISLLPQFDDSDTPAHRYVFSERNWHGYASHQRAARDRDGFLYIRNARPELNNLGTPDYVTFMYRMYQEGRLTAFQADSFLAPRPAEELYDYRNDPHQEVNLLLDEASAALHLNKLEELRGTMDRWQALTGDTTPERFVPDWYLRPDSSGVVEIPAGHEDRPYQKPPPADNWGVWGEAPGEPEGIGESEPTIRTEF